MRDLIRRIRKALFGPEVTFEATIIRANGKVEHKVLSKGRMKLTPGATSALEEQAKEG